MQIEFLGTGAVDHRVDEKGLPNFRRYSSVLIDGKILIDPNGMIFDYAASFRKLFMFSEVSTILVTHSHIDHLFLPSVAYLQKKRDIPVYGHKTLARHKEISHFVPLESMETFPVAGGYIVTALDANHVAPDGEQPMHYLIEKDGKSFFYGLDGSFYPPRTFNVLRRKRLSAAVLDYTLGDAVGDRRIFSHCNFEMVKMIRAAFLENGVADGNTKFLLTHLSKDGHPSHEAEVARVTPYGFTVMQDGDVIEI